MSTQHKPGDWLSDEEVREYVAEYVRLREETDAADAAADERKQREESITITLPDGKKMQHPKYVLVRDQRVDWLEVATAASNGDEAARAQMRVLGEVGLRKNAVKLTAQVNRLRRHAYLWSMIDTRRWGPPPRVLTYAQLAAWIRDGMRGKIDDATP
jgi:hypothetical protein